jgi:hypothetical protein
VVLRKRVAEVVVVDGVPRELYEPDSEIWCDAEKTERWLVRHGLRRRLRGREHLDAMGPRQRYNFAARAWIVSTGHFKEWAGSDKKSPDWVYMQKVGLPRVSDIGERLERARIDGGAKVDGS